MKLSIILLSLTVAVTASAAPAKSSKKKTDSAASKKEAPKESPAPTPAATPKNDVADASGAGAAQADKADVKAGAIVRGPNKVKAKVETRPLTGEAWVAPSIASLGEKWADSMTGEQIGTEADRKTWNPALTIGATQPVGAFAVELEGSGTQFSAPVPGGKTRGFVGHAAARVGYERGAFGGEVGALVRVADVETPDTKSNGTPQIFPSVEVRRTSPTGTTAFVAAWNNPVLPYGDEGWLRAGARHDWGRLAGELAVGIDPIFAGEEATGPVIDSRLDIAVGTGSRFGVALRAADEPMAALVMRRVW